MLLQTTNAYSYLYYLLFFLEMYVCIYQSCCCKLLLNTIAVKSSILLKLNLIALYHVMYVYIDMINLLYDDIIDDLMN